MKESSTRILQKLMEIYWSKLYNYLKANKHLIPTFTGFLLKWERIVFYFGKTHLAIEYYGPERIQELPGEGIMELEFHDLTQKDQNLYTHIIGFEYDSTIDIRFPLPPFAEDLIIPTNRAYDKLMELGWNFAAQDSILAMNAGNFYIPEGQFARHVNSLFFDADENGLKTRHIKWIDFIPMNYDDSNENFDTFSIYFGVYNQELIEHDAHYEYPLPDKDDFKYSKLPQINRFIELYGNNRTSEKNLTAFLAKKENNFIMSMAFFSKKIYHQLKCEWQNEKNEPIIPDFFVVQANGFANIVEFKLPNLKTKAIIGKQNRETFSAEINSYISQTRTYNNYFNDPKNREWVQKKYGFKVLNPRRTLVMGRRWHFPSDTWKEILSEFPDLDILNYDDLVDGVVAQFYL